MAMTLWLSDADVASLRRRAERERRSIEDVVRDYGLLESAAGRPQVTAFGRDAYPDLDAKAAALLHSLATSRALTDGNERLALAALIAFYGINGRRLTMTNEASWELVTKVADGQLDLVADIAAVLAGATEPRP
jgi:death on curing protein